MNNEFAVTILCTFLHFLRLLVTLVVIGRWVLLLQLLRSNSFEHILPDLL